MAVGGRVETAGINGAAQIGLAHGGLVEIECVQNKGVESECQSKRPSEHFYFSDGLCNKGQLMIEVLAERSLERDQHHHQRNNFPFAEPNIGARADRPSLSGFR